MNLFSVQFTGIILAAVLSPLYMGIAQKVKASMQGRRGPSVWQGYFVILKLWKKETTVPEYSSWIFRLAPSVSLSALIVIIALIPWGAEVPARWPHDLITVFFLLTLERFWTGLAGLDTAGTFGGLGASRITTLGSGIEPALFAVFGVLWVVSGGTDIVPIAPYLLKHPWSVLPWMLTVFGYVLVLMAELGRLPVDNVDTHLELTMMHEATLLEYSGRLLAQSQIAIAMKFTAIMALGWVWLGPVLPSPWLNLGLRFVELALTSTLIGLMESRFVKLRYFRLPAYLTLTIGTGILAVYAAATGGGIR